MSACQDTAYSAALAAACSDSSSCMRADCLLRAQVFPWPSQRSRCRATLPQIISLRCKLPGKASTNPSRPFCKIPGPRAVARATCPCVATRVSTVAAHMPKAVQSVHVARDKLPSNEGRQSARPPVVRCRFGSGAVKLRCPAILARIFGVASSTSTGGASARSCWLTWVALLGVCARNEEASPPCCCEGEGVAGAHSIGCRIELSC
jgi:hypothetical protein